MKYDYIVIGSGSAGSVVAGRLGADGRASVLLLEAGRPDKSFFLRMPLGYGMAYYDPALNWMYDSAPIEGFGGRTTYVPRGKVVGGSSSINAMVYSRGQPGDFEGWRAMGNPGWGWIEVLDAYRRIEDHAYGPSAVHGGSGPLSVSDRSEDAHPLCTRFFAAAEAAGFPFNSDLNGVSIEGVGYLQFTIRNGERMSASRAWLWPALKHKNLKLETGAHATRIRFVGRRATGVEYRRNTEVLIAEAQREIVVAAGSINSPQLLQLSGIGPGDLLAHFGIPVVLDSPAVGRHFQDHVCYDHVYRSRVPTLNRTLRSWPRKLFAGLRYLLARRGPLALGTSHAGGFVRSRPGLEEPNLQLYFSPLSYVREQPRTRRIMSPDRFEGFLMSVSNCRPTSRGFVAIATPDPLAAPVIQPNFLSTDHDVEEMLEGAHLLRRLAQSRAMQTVIDKELMPGPRAMSDEAFLGDIRARSYSIFHPVGTCRMGPDPREAVVDHRLRVHGIEALRVIDASIFPTVTTGNTNAPAMMVGERGAQFILEEARGA
jgi:choline dehydrogenase